MSSKVFFNIPIPTKKSREGHVQYQPRPAHVICDACGRRGELDSYVRRLDPRDAPPSLRRRPPKIRTTVQTLIFH